MKTILKSTVIGIVLVLMFLVDVPLLPVKVVPEAQAIFGVWRRHARRWAVVGTAAVATTAAVTTAAAATATAAAASETAAAQQQAAAARHQAAPAPSAAAPAAAGKLLPLGTVVSKLPGGCVSTPVGGVEYYYCGGNFYRAVFQGNELVYVTSQPK
jgi:type IV secretory pathway TrbL component